MSASRPLLWLAVLLAAVVVLAESGGLDGSVEGSLTASEDEDIGEERASGEIEEGAIDERGDDGDKEAQHPRPIPAARSMEVMGNAADPATPAQRQQGRQEARESVSLSKAASSNPGGLRFASYGPLADFLNLYSEKFHSCKEFHSYAMSIMGFGIASLILGVLSTTTGASTGSAPSVQCVVVSDRKVAVLAQPDITASTVDYLEVGATFQAVGRVVVGDGRVFYRLAGKRGWVPRCSRKDEAKVIVDTKGKPPGSGVEPPLGRQVVGWLLLLVTFPILLALAVMAIAFRLLQLLLTPLKWLCPCGMLFAMMDNAVAMPGWYITAMLGGR
eukprot:TRINITY_DN114852_c0_g1_i1.p1 TRINITY_DN114852_c0_g1~~TRINITY_DN114852_c0_g1_i1.p1  ORF type:complete len:330 (+),score=68.64 TRINITY_DN114852_c0_g1_i1:63-1052(+)